MATAAEILTLSKTVVQQVRSVEPPLTFTITVEWVPEDEIYLAKCPEMQAIGWGQTIEEALDELADELWDFANVLVETAEKKPNVRDPSLPYARFLFSLGSEEGVRRFLGL